jgi:membrane-associated phospholipid phosphatase
MAATKEVREAFSARFERWLSDPGGQLRRSRLAVVIACFYVLFAATYLPINLFSVGRPAATPYIPGEEQLPFLPIFEYLYVVVYFVGALLVVTIRDYSRFLLLARAFALSLLCAYTTYLLFPVYLERPHLEVTSLHTWLLSLQYMDKSYNHLPSLHVTLSWLAVHASQVTARTRVGLSLLAVGLSVSTVFVKQHYIADVFAGFVLAWGAWWLVNALASNKVTSPIGVATTSAAE